MKSIKISLISLFIFPLFSSLGLYGQDPIVKYTYDDNGNRILRETIFVTLMPDSTDISDTTDLKKKFSIEEDKEGIASINETIVGKCEIHVYPNPFSESITVELIGLQPEQNAKLDLYSTNGIKLLSVQELQNINKIEVAHLVPASYFLLISIDQKCTIWKLIKR